MLKDALHSLDVAVALRCVEAPGEPYRALAAALGLSPSTAHKSVQRLLRAGLLRLGDDGLALANRNALLEFLEHGVKYAFPAVLGAPARGVPTAHVGPALAAELSGSDPVVWPDPQGPISGASVEPLLSDVAALPSRCPGTYAMLTAVDAVRLGRARERRIATAFLRQRLTAAPTPAPAARRAARATPAA
jgi:hypothetical protein